MKTHQPKPTGEWTVRELDFGFWGLYRSEHDLISREFHNRADAEVVADAHNAALDEAVDAAEQEILLLGQQLAAEREKFNKELREYESALSDTHLSRIKRLEQQLDAARWATEVEINEGVAVRDINHLNRIYELERQLAAEREKVKLRDLLVRTWQENYADLQQQLAGERAKVTLATQMVQIESKRANEAEKQLAAAQAAKSAMLARWQRELEYLKSIKLTFAGESSLYVTEKIVKELSYGSDTTALDQIKDALAKVGK